MIEDKPETVTLDQLLVEHDSTSILSGAVAGMRLFLTVAVPRAKTKIQLVEPTLPHNTLIKEWHEEDVGAGRRLGIRVLEERTSVIVHVYVTVPNEASDEAWIIIEEVD